MTDQTSPADGGQQQASTPGFAPPAPPQGVAGPPPAYAPPPGGAYAYGAPVLPPPVANGKRFGTYLVEILLAFVTLGIGWLIWSIVLWSKGTGQSPAKLVMKLRVLNVETGRAASFGDMAMRELVGKAVLSSVTFGITTIVSAVLILGQSRQGIWDKLAKTVVVDDPNEAYGPPT